MYNGEKVRLRAYRREDAVLAQQYINDDEQSSCIDKKSVL